MRGRSSTGGKPLKAGRKATAPKRPNGPKPARPHKSPAAGEKAEVARLRRELNEAQEQQAATSEVLRVISSSSGDLEPVFRTMLVNALRICRAKFGFLRLFDGKEFRLGAAVGMPRTYDPLLILRDLDPEDPLVRVTRTRKPVHIRDTRTERIYTKKEASFTRFIDRAGARSLLVVPMVRGDDVAGTFAIYRQEARAFTDKQIALVTNFAAQAVIAIENTRLLNELHQRTDDLTESLDQQTATSEVLRVISSSPGELGSVFEAMLETATRICEAKFGNMYLRKGDVFHLDAAHNTPPAFIEERTRTALRTTEENGTLGRMMRTINVVHVTDLTSEEFYLSGNPLAVAAAELGGVRTYVFVPLIKEAEVVGYFSIFRQEVKPFTAKQIELLKNFAAQAVIAIENTRLLNELRQRTNELGQRTDDLTEALEQQTAISEILRVISSSPSEVQPVLDSVAEHAARICAAQIVDIVIAEDDRVRIGATFGDLGRPATRELIPLNRATVMGRSICDMQPVHVEDLQNAGDEFAVGRELALKFGHRTIIAVPLLRDGRALGTILVRRAEVNPFEDKHITLLTTFADQAAIAIENVRLFENVESRTRELAQSLEDLRATQDRLVQTEKLASLGQLTAGIAHEIKNPLNFVNNFSGVSVELIDELQETLSRIKADDKTQTEIIDLADTLRGNLDKIVQHGSRADSIVKNMLLHSRQGSAEHRLVDINALVEESLNLAYHGARAEMQGFNITLERSLDPAAGEADVFPQDITRVLLNLISNGFYAATNRKTQADGGDGYEPTLAAATRNVGDSVEIIIRDNGIGIPPEVKEQMFNPFFTTKPAGEGTGLGLSISHDIIVKQHGGSIEVDTQPGAYTEFRIILPRKATILGEGGTSA
ncbi:MAG: GAF domain-containing protein [Pseudolabrys sp.]